MLSLAIIGIVLACKKETTIDLESLANPIIITADDAATIIKYDLSTQTGGLNSVIVDASRVANARNSGSYCGKSKDSTFSKNSNGAYPNVSSSFTQKVSFLLTCTIAKVPASLSYLTNSSGQYQTPNTTSNDTGNGNLIISGLEVTSSTYVVNGTFVRDGTQNVNLDTQKTLTSKVTLTMEGIKVNKSTFKIQTGSKVSAIITGSSSSGKKFSFTGIVKYNDDGTLTITLNGKDYMVTI